MKIHIRDKNKDILDIDTVYVKDFGDNYHRTDFDPSDELTQLALDIRRIYKKQSTYRRAVAIFNEYFYKLVDKYGGTTMFRIALQSGQVTEYLPPIPKLKNKRYQHLFKKNIILSEVNMKKVSPEDIVNAIQAMDNGEQLYMAKVDAQVKGLEKIEKVISKHNVAQNPLQGSKDISVLENYFANRHREEEENRASMAETITLTELMSDDFYEILAKLQGDDEDELVTYNGKLVTRDMINNIEVIKELYNLGWNTTKILNAMDADTRVLEITKNDRKDAKKARKRNAKAEGVMAKIMSDGKFNSFDAFESAVTNASDEAIFNRFRD